jgi:hypothetical protein
MPFAVFDLQLACVIQIADGDADDLQGFPPNLRIPVPADSWRPA